MKYILHYKSNSLTRVDQVELAPGKCELEGERILCNDIHLPGSINYHNSGLWVIGNEYGPLGAAWGNEQDALDALVDGDLAAGILIDEKDADEDSPRLGNAGEPACLDNAWMGEVEFKPERDLALLLAFARAEVTGENSLWD
jgi:hypothetical protein